MDDPSDNYWSWPHWKFGLKRDDLFTTLHHQYNTVPSPILDPEAFHHDVCELSHQARTAGEFHRLLQDRKEQRLRELNETLESAAFEIIANPSLIGTEQWQHAVQLFRTKSLDSLVRYFASYLPQDHPWYKSASPTSMSEVGSSVDSLADSHGTLFDDDDGPTMTDEPLEYETSLKSLLPPSPRSMTMCSDSSVASPIGDDPHHDYDLGKLTPARTLSFSESEPDCRSAADSHSHHDDELRPQCSASTSPGTVSETVSCGVEETGAASHTESGDEDSARRLSTADVTELETPTPKPEGQSASFFDHTKPSLPHRRYRSLSPSRPHPLSDYDPDDHDLDDVLASHRDPRNPPRSRLIRRERSPARRRKGGRGFRDAATRVQKPLPEAARSKPSRRRWVDS
ncbi:hypothetical protein VTK56DRAFT_5748 [Thermocarpiscus australiensis]